MWGVFKMIVGDLGVFPQNCVDTLCKNAKGYLVVILRDKVHATFVYKNNGFQSEIRRPPFGGCHQAAKVCA